MLCLAGISARADDIVIDNRGAGGDGVCRKTVRFQGNGTTFNRM